MALVPVAEDAKTKRYYKYYEQNCIPDTRTACYDDASKGSM